MKRKTQFKQRIRLKLFLTILLPAFALACAPPQARSKKNSKNITTISEETSSSTPSSLASLLSSRFELSPPVKELAVGGSQTFLAINGTEPYTYNFLTGASVGTWNSSTNTFTASSTGVALIQAIDAEGKTAFAIAVVNGAPVLSPATKTLAVDNTFTFSTTNGTPPYSYSVQSGGGSIHASSGLFTAPASSGTSIVKVTDANGQSSTSTVTIASALSVSPSSASIPISSTQTLSISGGVPPYSSTLISGEGTATDTTFTATGNTGVSVLEIEDSVGNRTYSTFTITQPLILSPAVTTLNEGGTQSFSASGGTGSYTFTILSGGGSLSSQSTSAVLTPPAAPSEVVLQVTDSGGATAQARAIIISGSSFTLASQALSVNEQVTFSAVGGLAPLKYYVLNSANCGSIDNLSGVYTAPATLPSDPNCLIRAIDANLKVTEAYAVIYPALSLSPASKTLAVTNTFQFGTVGGVGPYTYSVVTSSCGSFSGSLYTAPDSAKTCIIRVTDSQNRVASTQVRVRDSLKIIPTSLTLGASTTSTITASGGSTPYKFKVLSGAGSLVQSGSTTATYVAYSTQGTAIVEVRDSVGNTANTVITIAPEMLLLPSELSVRQKSTNQFAVYGGVSPYTFTVHSGGGSILRNEGEFTAPESAGTSVVKVSDALGLYKTATIQTLDTLAINPSSKNLPVSKKQIFQATGGLAPYTFSLSGTGCGTAESNLQSTSTTTTYTAPSIVPGNTCTITLTDSGTPTASVSSTVTIVPSLEITPSGSISLVQGASQVFTLSGGLTAYSATSGVGGKLSALGSTQFVFTAPSNGASGNLVFEDSSGQQVIVNVTVQESLKISPSTLAGISVNGTQVFTAQGGSEVYSFAISGSGCSGSLSTSSSTAALGGVTTFTAPSTSASSCSVVVTDSSGSTASASFNVLEKVTLSYSGSAGTSGTVNSVMSISPSTANGNGSSITGCKIEPGSLNASLWPKELTFNSLNCTISGTPTKSLSATSFSVIAQNAAGWMSTPATLSLSIAAIAPTLSYGNGSYTHTVQSPLKISPIEINDNGASISQCSISPALPTGLSIHANTCVISGTPTVIQASQVFSVTATNSAGSSTAASFSLSIASDSGGTAPGPTISFEGATGTSGVYGGAMSVSPTTLAANGGSSISNCTVSPALPTGLSIHSTTCVISGMPEQAVTQTRYIVQVTNALGGVASSDLFLSVAPNTPTLSYAASVQNLTAGSAVNISPSVLAARGATITDCRLDPTSVTTPLFPSTLSIHSTTCVISGTPDDVLSETTFSILAKNAVGTSSASNITLSISAGVPQLTFTGSTQNLNEGTPYSLSPITLKSNGSEIVSCATKTGTPPLPNGLVIDTNSCVISGVPSLVTTSQTYTLVATNGVGASSDANVVIQVFGPAPMLSYSASTGTTGTVGSAMSVAPSTLNDYGSAVTQCSVSPALPAGLSINTNTCVISGTPTSAQLAKDYSVVATNATGAGAPAVVSITIQATTPTLSYAGNAATFQMNTSGSKLASVSSGGATITSCKVKPGSTNENLWPTGLSINNNTCEISGSALNLLSATLFTIQATNSWGLSDEASINLTVGAGVPTLTYSGATSLIYGEAAQIHPATLIANGENITDCEVKSGTTALPSGLSVNSSTCVISGTTSTVGAGNYTIRVTNTVGSTDANISITVLPNTPTLSYSNSTATVGTALTLNPTLQTRGASLTSCSVKSGTPALPAGLTISNTTCVISGTPTTVSAATTYTLVATNSAGSSNDATVSITVNSGLPVLSFAGASGTSGNIGDAMSVTPTTLTGNGSAITACSATTALPAGLSVNSTTCVISGTPTATTNQAYTLNAINANGSSSDATVTLVISGARPVLSYSGSTGTSGAVGVAMSITPTTLNDQSAAGGITGCALTTGSLPSGLSLNATTCVISGTPAIAAITTGSTYSIRAQSAHGYSDVVQVSLVISASAPTLSYSNQSLTAGTAANISATLSNEGSTITSCVLKSGSSNAELWPNTLSIHNTTCAISGTPSATLSSTVFTVRVTNAIGSTDATIQISIAAGLPTLSYADVIVDVDDNVTITPTLANNGSAITSGSCILAATNNPTNENNLWPADLTINSNTCVITGTPTSKLSAKTFQIQVTNAVGTRTATFNLAISAIVPTLSYAGATGSSGYINSSMSITPTALTLGGDSALTGCGLVGSPSSLPTGLSLNSSTCVISGTPTALLAATTYTVRASNSAGYSEDASVIISVGAAIPLLSYAGATGTTGTVGSAMSISPTTLTLRDSALTGCAIKSGTTALPTGLSVNASTCVISGTPSISAVATTYTLVASNSVGSSADASVSITVQDNGITLANSGWNSSDKGAGVVLSNSDLTATITGYYTVRSVRSKSYGKWYWEVTAGSSESLIGIATSSHPLDQYVGNVSVSGNAGYSYYGDSGAKFKTAVGPSAYGAAFSVGNTIGVALDLENGTLEFYKNGVSQGTAFTGVNGVYYAAVGCGVLQSCGGNIINLNATVPAGLQAQGFKSFNYIAQPISTSESSFTLSASSAVPGTSVAATITLKDSSGNLLANREVRLSSSRGAIDTISTSPTLTNGSGIASFSIETSTYGVASLTASVPNEDVTLTSQSLGWLGAASDFEYQAALAKLGTSAGNNTDPTSVWDTFGTASATYDGVLNNFGYSTSSGWKGDGSSTTVDGAYQLVFDGLNDYVNFSTMNNSSNNITLETWFKPHAVASPNAVLLSNGDSSDRGITLRQSSKGNSTLEATLGSGLSYRAEVLADNPIAYYRFNETSGTTAADEMGTHNGTYTSVSLNQANAIQGESSGKSISFANAGRVAIAHHNQLSLVGSHTIEAWVKPASSTMNGNDVILAKGGYHYLLYFAANNKITIWHTGLTPNTLTSSAVLAQGVWSHVVATYNATTGVKNLYINGQLDVTQATVGTHTTSTAILEIGASDGGSYCMNGGIDEVSFYLSELSDQRVLAHYNAQNRLTCFGQSALANNFWNHAAAVFTSSTGNLKLYLNGNEECSSTYASASYTNSTSNFIAGASSALSNFWSGAISSIKSFTSALSAAQIRANIRGTWSIFPDYPKSVGGLLAWYKADSLTASNADLISQWNDSSGNNYHATQANVSLQPTFRTNIVNAQPVVRFDGSNDYLSVGTQLGKPNSHSVFVVFSYANASTNKLLLGSIASNGSGNTTWGLVDYHTPAGVGSFGFEFGNESAFSYGRTTSGLTSTNTFYVYSFVYETGICQLKAYLNGVERTLTYQSCGATSSTGTAYEFSLGRAGAYDGSYGQADIAEVIIYNTAVSAAERQRIEGYLNTKYNLY